MTTVELISTLHLPAKDKNGSSDPFVEITIGGESHVTPIQKKTLNPTWGNSYAIGSAKIIRGVVKDWDRVTSNDTIGTFEVDLTTAPRNKDFYVPLLWEGEEVVGKDGFSTQIWLHVSGPAAPISAPPPTSAQIAAPKKVIAAPKVVPTPPSVPRTIPPVPYRRTARRPPPAFARKALAEREAKATRAKVSTKPVESDYEYYYEDDTGPPAPPPPPPPSAPKRVQVPTPAGAGRGGLMAAIRNAGGTGGAGLHHVEETAPAKAPPPLANNHNSVLAAALARRRTNVSSMANDGPNGFVQDW